ncbi:MAG TPA: response regulator [Phenylobacterium sp.]
MSSFAKRYAPTDEAPADVWAPPTEPRRQLNVLHVDDEAMNLVVVKEILSAFGHSAQQAWSGAEALERLAKKKFDVILMDIHMPGMSGIETVARLRAAEGPNQKTPVIALTADTVSRGLPEYLQLGFADYVTKPILVSRLMSGLAHAAEIDPDRLFQGGVAASF